MLVSWEICLIPSGKGLVGIISTIMVSSVLGFVILDKNHEEQSKDLGFSEQEEV